MLTASLLSSVLALASPSSPDAAAPSHHVLPAKRDDAPVGIMGVLNKAARPLIMGAVATGGGVLGGVTATLMGLGGMVLMAVGFIREDGVPGQGVADFQGKLDEDTLINGLIFDLGRYGIIAAIFLGAFALIITGAGLGLVVGSLVVQE